MRSNERGSILLFTLFFLLILSGLIYKVLSPYRQMVRQAESQIVQEKGLSYLFSLENVVQTILPRIDLNLYRQLNRIKPGEPIELILPTPEGIVKGALYASNNCLNITRSSLPNQQETQRIAELIKRLSRQVLGENDSAQLLVEALLPPELTSGNTSLTEEREAVISFPKTLPDPQIQHALTLLRPYLCRRALPGQNIDINAIDKQSLPVLKAILPADIGEVALVQLYQQRGNQYWSTVKDFIDALPHPEKVTSEVEAMLATSSQTYRLTFEYQASESSFSSVTYFARQGESIIISGRRFIMDNSL